MHMGNHLQTSVSRHLIGSLRRGRDLRAICPAPVDPALLLAHEAARHYDADV